ncbi:patatin-like phospholipase family protein [Qaidamihabitans albus]|uniref:patatin-like phospholipase family protein n=1 Tax=Qaidamihabitans albus TaxID=2795733 RepID=UPI0018F18FD2|nr:patatin-like phospholipase family protein [Qaidamihabitans albus]
MTGITAEPGDRVAFVLSGGASLGAIQVGMLHALYERGIAPDLLIATSVGALNAAFIASRPPTVRTATTLTDVWSGLHHRDVFPLSPWTALLGLLGKSDHFVSARRLRRMVKRRLEFDSLDRAPTPLHVIATDLLTGAERRLSAGPAVDAVLASAALPGVFPPVRFGDRRLIDGGVTNNTPISQALALGATRVYVLPTGYACALRRPPGSALGVAAHALSLLIQQRLVNDIQRIPDGFPMIVLPPPCPLAVTPADFSYSAELIRRSLAGSRAVLDLAGAADAPRTVVPDNMRSPYHEHPG